MRNITLIFLLLLATNAVAIDSLYIQGQDAAGIRDTRIRQNDPYTRKNFGGHTDINVTAQAGAVQNILIDIDNLDTIGDTATHVIRSMYVDLWCKSQVGATIEMRKRFKPLFEGTGVGSDSAAGTACWPLWYHVFGTNDSAYGTAGCANASDAGGNNRTSGSGYDRASTAMASVVANDTGSFDAFQIDSAYANACYKAGVPIQLIFTTANTSLTSYSSSEGTDATKRVRARIYYDVEAAPPASRNRIVPLLRRNTE